MSSGTYRPWLKHLPRFRVLTEIVYSLSPSTRYLYTHSHSAPRSDKMDTRSTGEDLGKDLTRRLYECGATVSRLDICARSTQNKYVRRLLSPRLFQEEHPENLIWFKHNFRTHVLPPRLPPPSTFHLSARLTLNRQLSFNIIVRHDKPSCEGTKPQSQRAPRA